MAGPRSCDRDRVAINVIGALAVLDLQFADCSYGTETCVIAGGLVTAVGAAILSFATWKPP